MNIILKSALISILAQTVFLHAETTVTNIAGGGAHTLLLKSDGSLWAMGYGIQGQLGDGQNNFSTYRAVQVLSNGVVAIAGGNDHSLFIKSGGSLWSMGWNSDGELGTGGSYYFTNTPQLIVPDGVTAIAGGVGHSLFLRSDGSLWAMGRNSEGQLGNGTTNNVRTPQQIVSGGCMAISSQPQGYFSLFLKSDGSLWAMGDNYFGQLGDGTTINSPTPKQIVPSGVTAIAAGGSHSLFIKSDGSLWGMGRNVLGQLGDGSTQSTNRAKQIVSQSVVAVAAGYNFTLFIKSDGSLWGMGDDNSGQLGDGKFKDDGTSAYSKIPVNIVTNGVVAVSCGNWHSLFLKSNESFWAMGANGNGRLGDGFTNSYSNVPEQILPTPKPELSLRLASKTNLQLAATCQFGGVFYLLSSSNLEEPLDHWVRIRTNSIQARGTNNFTTTLTNAVNPGAGGQFYILQSQ